MKAVIFDMDGTIVLSHPVHFEAYKKFFEGFGINWTYEEFEKKFMIQGASSIIRSVLKEHRINPDNKNIDKLRAKKINTFNSLVTKQPPAVVKGFFEFLEKVNERGLQKAVASGSHMKNLKKILDAIGVRREFPILVSSADEDIAPKPAPDIFLRTAKLLGIAPADCVVIEDTIFGIKAAKAAGMKCIAFTTTNPNAEELRRAGADEVATDYNNIELD